MGEQQVRLVLLAGGQGRRMWPLSHARRAKQLLPLLPGTNGEQESLLKRLWRQLGNVGLHQDTFIAISRHQTEALRNEIPASLNVIQEPVAAGINPAVALVASYLHTVAAIPLHEIIAVVPADLYVEDEEWFETLKELPEQLRKHQLSRVLTSDSSGIIAFQLKSVISALTEEGLPLAYEQLFRHYEELQGKLESVVSRLLEGSPTFRMPELPFHRINSWNSLAVLSENASIYNDSAVPVIMMGQSDIIVAVSSAGILIANRKEAIPDDRLRKLSEEEQKPLVPGYEAGQWGNAVVLSCTSGDDGQQSITRKLEMIEGECLSYAFYMKRKKIWTLLTGVGELIRNEKRSILKAGDVVEILPGERHTLLARSGICLLEAHIGPALTEDDRIVLADHWEEVRTLMSS
ncbi:sugar phosphate nucleotidyltransferase [Paenibacillus glycanilyticus]|uniref:Mannose-1-phosphate guanylyltransferase n=1 Tax=Paenibacillus glycanilyticus TaxID=126569 RepID=A0ABQ6GAE0_9BACL|nr:sugar phosphate nucleotidyltransferase [Paenibacillus glycanilyticus]GLX66022.1 mannose-1-phosphate guanylyltransferase [Paenibacillus glycanilyticus]